MSNWFLAASFTGTACALVGIAVITVGWSRRIPEVTFIGTGLFSLSLFTAAFGLSGVDIGVKFGVDIAVGAGSEHAASPFSALLAFPTAIATMLPLIMPATTFGRFLSRRWRTWTASWILMTIAVCWVTIGMAAVPGPVTKFLLTGTGVLGSFVLIKRQLFLYQVSGQAMALTTAASVAVLAACTSASHTVEPGSAASWTVLTMQGAAVLTVGVAVIVGYRIHRSVADVLDPILGIEPLAALELGMSPELQAFVTALDQRDPTTREHVLRTSALAMHIAIRAELPQAQVRDIALGTLLHDIGKLVVPRDLANKSAGLRDTKYAAITTHPEQGEALLLGSASLASAARYVRWHHEYVDGSGYPDQLVGDEISLEVGIVSVADAWDAMTNTRQYRNGLGTERATAILRQGVGVQWRADAVLLLLAEVASQTEATLRTLGSASLAEGEDLVSTDIAPANESPICCGEAVSYGLLHHPDRMDTKDGARRRIEQTVRP